MKDKIRWYIYTFLMAVFLYWLSNLILWKPWSVSPVVGMTLMLTLNPLIWGMGEYSCLRRYPFPKSWGGAGGVAIILTVVSVVSDYLFFDLWLHSGDIWHPTTFYGYAFISVLPFLIRGLFRRRLIKYKARIADRNLLYLGLGIAVVLFIFFVFVF